MNDRPNHSLMWWAHALDADRLTVGRALVAYASELEAQPSQKSREERWRRYARLYGNAEIFGLKPWEMQNVITDTRLMRNVVASCIDTAQAAIAANRPAPQFLTNGADFAQRQKTKKLNKFGKGVLHASSFYEIAPLLFLDGAAFGTGLVKAVECERAIEAERVFPWDVLVEDTDGRNRAPRAMTQRMYIAREVALSRWTDPEAQTYIRMAPRVERGGGDSQASDHIVLYESTYLARPGAPDSGRHCIAVAGYALEWGTWKRSEHPFAVFRWKEALSGFWGIGIAESIQSIQFEINTLLAKIQASMLLAGKFDVFLQMGSGVPKAHVTNDLGNIYTYNAGTQPPTVVAHQSVHPELFEQVDRLEVKAFDEVGVSQMASRSEKPAGLDSGVALREYNDIKSDRFVMVGRRWERVHLDFVDRALDIAREIRGFEVDVPDKNSKVTIRWTDVNLKRDAYILQCFPTSLLPQTPAGRVQAIQDLTGLGVLPQDQMLEMLDIPDLEEITDLATASRRVVRSVVEGILERGEDGYVAPDPRLNLTAALSFVNAVYLEECVKGCPEDRLELLRRYVDELVALIQQAQAASAPPAGAAAAPMPGPQPATPPAAPPMAA